ncbi:MAG: hypothetical protein DRN20_01615 [Thermoplasmata archaeon]|nr:MAG: hypothetical protein DRN20_01615 [Thermoplasmata archaeon]
MGSEVKYVMEENWDFLIVLDACRYDYFNKFYRDFFNSGTLQKAISPGRETVEWCVKNFTEYYHDVIYISPIPFINSMKAVKYRGFYFDAKKHFYRVVDLWKHGWDNTLQTVRPEAVNTAALTLLKLHPNKRLIIHYMQPHAPYLSLNVPSSNILPKKAKKECGRARVKYFTHTGGKNACLKRPSPKYRN